MALGVVLTPYGNIPGSYPAAITHSYRGATSWAQPFDPQFYARGETGYYYDTELGSPGKRIGLGLGAIPTDFDLAKRYGFLPVGAGWTVTKQGYQPGGWLPPDGGYPGQPPATRLAVVPLSGLGGVPAQQPATADDVLALMAQHNDRVFALTLVSTSAVAISALITIFRTLKLIKGGKGD